MKYIKQKSEAGVLDIFKIPVYKLLEYAQEASREDKDYIGNHLMYDKDTGTFKKS